MAEENVFEELAARINLAGSERLPRIWRMICDDEEARLLLEMPGTVDELAGKSGMNRDRVEEMIAALFRKGVVFEKAAEEGTIYRMCRHVLQFHDASILWPEAGDEFHAAWQDFMETEYIDFIRMMDQAEIRPFMRVVPVNQALDPKSQVLAYEDAIQMIDGAKRLAVTDCTCRLTAKKCDAPLEVCMQINRAADYAVKRGTGREITKEEAKQIIKESEDAGLVHLSDNRAGIGLVICNCCSCCCMMVQHIAQLGIACLAAPSRYTIQLVPEKCNGCGECIGRCPVQVLSMEGSKDGLVTVAFERCIGCGLCTTACPTDALFLQEMRPAEFIPA